MKICIPILFLLHSCTLFSQNFQYRVVNEISIADSLVMQTVELLIFNNTENLFCLKVSTSFEMKLSGIDTIELAASKDYYGCLHYNLAVSKEDAERGFNVNPSFPLILNRRTCFAVIIQLTRNLKCKDSWIEYSYVNGPEINYNEIIRKHKKGEQWDGGLKFRTRKICMEAECLKQH